MLRNLRLFASSFVGGIFIILLAVPFLFTDMSQFGRGQGDPAVTVNDERIYADVVVAIANQVLRANGKQLNGNPTSVAEARNLPNWTQIENLILSNVTVEQILAAELDGQRWTASVEEIIALIPEDPNFQVLGNYEPLQAELALNTLQAEQAYIKQRRIQLNAERLQSFVASNAPNYVPTAAAKNQFDFATRLYAFDTLTLSGSSEDVGEPTDKELQTILNDKPENYRTEEYRAFSAIIIDPNEMARTQGFEAFLEMQSDVKGDLKNDLTWEKYLDENPQIMSTAVEEAAELAKLVQDTQQDGVEVSSDSFDIRDATITDLSDASGLKVQSFDGIDRFGRFQDNTLMQLARKHENFLEDLFLLEQIGEPSEIRILDNGVAFVLQIDAITEARDMTFDEARARLAALWRYNKQKESLSIKAESYLSDLETGKINLAQLAIQEGIEIDNGALADLATLANTGIQPAEIFSMNIGNINGKALGNLFMFYQLRELGQQNAENTDLTLDDVREQIAQAFVQSLEFAFQQGIEDNTDISVKQREWDAALDEAILAANNAGYFNGG